MNTFTYTQKPNAETKSAQNGFFFSSVLAEEYSNYARILSSIIQHNFNYTCTYTTTCVVYILVIIKAMKGLSIKTI